MEKLHISEAILVEGKYDKIRLSSFIDATILTTDGFSVFNNREKCSLLRRITAEKGIIILTDSDGAGFVIRNKLKGIIGDNSKIKNIYVPQILGKEARKAHASKQGLLGVEGIDNEIIRDIFEKAGIVGNRTEESKKSYTKQDLFAFGLSGGADSAVKRNKVCADNSLPEMSANAFLEAVNILGIDLEKYFDY